MVSMAAAGLSFEYLNEPTCAQIELASRHAEAKSIYEQKGRHLR